MNDHSEGIEDEQSMIDFLDSQPKRKPPVKKAPEDQTWKPRYEEMYRRNFVKQYPEAFKEHGYIKTPFPDTRKANGLQRAIVNYINWAGYRATRISTTGRMIDGRYIPGNTRRGTADVSATINGRSIMLEVKVGADKPSPEQLAEQAKEQAAGGQYHFIHSMQEFFVVYDKVCILQ